MPGVVLGFLQNDTTSYRLCSYGSTIGLYVVIYNINAMKIKLTSCADISEI